MALISLEDLEGLDEEQLEEEQLDQDITDNPEPTGGDDQLLQHWQAVASTHQVSVPPGVCVCACLSVCVCVSTPKGCCRCVFQK